MWVFGCLILKPWLAQTWELAGCVLFYFVVAQMPGALS